VLFDIETLPNLPEALKVWTQLSDFPGRTFAASISSVICFGYKILGEKKTHCISAWDFPQWQKDVNDDVPLLKAALEVLMTADAIVSHNGRSFDAKFLQTRLAIKNLPSLPPVQHVDTKNEAKRNLKLFSNSLKHACEQLTGARKLQNDGWDLWIKTHARDAKAQEKMRTYCKGDVIALEALYLKLRKYSKDTPNHNIHQIGNSKNLCHACGSSRLRSEGIRSTQTQTYRRYNCKDCGAWTRTDSKDRWPRPI
jgi:hypothetical protein